jgi:hypothetical protein
MRASDSPSTVLPGQLPLVPAHNRDRRELAAALLSGMLSRTRRKRVVIEPPHELDALMPLRGGRGRG